MAGLERTVARERGPWCLSRFSVMSANSDMTVREGGRAELSVVLVKVCEERKSFRTSFTEKTEDVTYQIPPLVLDIL